MGQVVGRPGLRCGGLGNGLGMPGSGRGTCLGSQPGLQRIVTGRGRLLSQRGQGGKVLPMGCVRRRRRVAGLAYGRLRL